ncbi:hypothetical protein ACHAXA_011222 [Cyclostephanos tholiformis]|uniref:HSF-type DNA-binding domain-containing protein n=1 Tax=Cyclostephanos tholiformis TaxID=382380 RepID=A0ABD3R6P0_9STRA
MHAHPRDVYDDEYDDLSLYLGAENISNLTTAELPSYRDLSRVSCNDLAVCVTDPAAQRNFPVLLHHLLFKSMFDDAIKWLPHGRAFVITNRARFCADVCPLIVNSHLYEAFIERIEEYGFQQTHYDDGHADVPLAAFYHERFLCSRWWLAYSMKSGRDYDRAVPMTVIAPPHSEEHAQLVLRSLHLLPALEYETDLSQSVMVRLHASLMIANKIPIGNMSPTGRSAIADAYYNSA